MKLNNKISFKMIKTLPQTEENGSFYSKIQFVNKMKIVSLVFLSTKKGQINSNQNKNNLILKNKYCN